MDLSHSYEKDLVGQNCQYLKEYDGMFKGKKLMVIWQVSVMVLGRHGGTTS